MTTEAQVSGPAVPTSSAKAALRPLGVRDVTIQAGPLARWQQLNGQTSIPLGLKQLEAAGNLHNLRLAAGTAQGEFRGPRFMDSDVYKQLEAVAWALAAHPDDDLLAFVDEVAELLEKAQRDNGYLNSYYQVVKPDEVYDHLEYSHEMYCAGHLIQAAVAAARAGAAPKLLEVARRFADHLVDEFLTKGNPGVDGHPEIETALVELYRLTGERPYLDLATKLIDERGKGGIVSSGMGAHYLQDHLPVREADTAVGHAVRQLYLDAGVVDVYLETGDESLLECSVRRWEDMVASKTYLTGALGSRHSHEAFGDRYELPPDRAYAETCAAIASIHWSWRLLLATGEARYADLIERTLYNAFAGSTSADGERFFYVNPLQRRADHLEGDDPGRRNPWFSCACCPPNIMRLVATFGHYVATTSDAGVQLHQFVSGTIQAGEAKLSVETDYPWSGTVRITVDETPAGEWTLAVRIPQWDRANDAGTYRTFTRVWLPGDEITVEVDLTPRITHPNRRIDAVRGSVAVERGPLVYCFEQVDQPVDLENLVLAPDAELRVVDADSLEGVGRTVRVEVGAGAVTHESSAWPYSTSRNGGLTAEPVTATAIPYFQWDNRDGRAMRVWLPLA